MTNSNPYQTPQNDYRSSPPTPRLLVTTLGIVLGCSTAGGLLGALTGLALGWLNPDYYRSVFAAGHSPDFDPIAVGVGQGLTQGIALGSCIGLALVFMHYWFQTRRLPRK